MKVALFAFGSVESPIKEIEKYLPEDTTGIEIEGSMSEVFSCARDYARKHSIPFGENYPNRNKFGNNASNRNIASIIVYANMVIAFWDGESNDIIFVKKFCEYVCVPLKVYMI